MSLKALTIAMMAKVPVLIWGPPGVGKTASFTDLCQSLDIHLETVIASIREPSDFSGLPIQGDDGTVKYSPPSWAYRLLQHKNAALFLDEISTAPPAVQAALLRVVLDKCIGDLSLPDDVAIIAAANPPEQAANGWELSPPLANRFCHFTWKDNLDTWAEGMISGWPSHKKQELPANWNSPMNIQLARVTIVSFVKSRPNLRNSLPKDEASMGKAWPSNRTWDMAARLLAAARAFGLADTSDTVFELISGCVGDGPALEFRKYAEGDELPDLEYVLANPKKLTIPERGDRAYALLSGIAAIVVANNTMERWNNGWVILSKAADMKVLDIAASCARILVKNRPAAGALPPNEALRFKSVLDGAGLWS
jgi:hypothetical protein